MDNKVLDEAVEVARKTRLNFLSDISDEALEDPSTEQSRDAMRAALLAVLPVLLGEPAWFLCELYDDTLNYDEQVQFFRSRSEAEEYEREGYKMTALYAPSLGEGDGR